MSLLEHLVDREFLVLVISLGVLCGSAATMAVLSNDFSLGSSKAWYLSLSSSTLSVWIATFFRFFLILSNLVPISLYVTLDVVKSLQAYFMKQDLRLYDEQKNQGCLVRTMSLNEELGQIGHIFSDKTGTMTCNLMTFRKCCIQGHSYGHTIETRSSHHIRPSDIENSGRRISEIELVETKFKSDKVDFHDEVFDRHFRATGEPMSLHLHEFLLHLAICHSVIPENQSHPDLEASQEFSWELPHLSASSPDEEAFVTMASLYGYIFLQRSPGKIQINLPTNELATFDILEMFEFSSERKRMSVLVRNPLTQKLQLLIKGSDTVIFSRLAETDTTTTGDHTPSQVLMQTKCTLEEYAKEGLRTLVFAKRDISESFYSQWSKDFATATMDLNTNELARLVEEMESNLTLIGVTAIEDKLQDHVPETLEAFKHADIRLWMLTGDHPETAMNIAISSHLISSEATQIHLTSSCCSKSQDVFKVLHSIALQMTQQELSLEAYVMVIDGETLYYAVEEKLVHLFIEIAEKCQVVLACRVSPGQKALLIQLMKEHSSVPGRTLAIGDGANDVPMLQVADIGIGIYGKEGLQAVNSSDYVLSQFSYLRRLLLCHGRYNYQRCALVICYIFYKNILLVMSQFWYSMVCGMSGQKFYNEWAVNFFNTLYTSAPIVVVGVLDMDVPSWIAEGLPGLYISGKQNWCFNRRVFWKWIVSGIIESGIICLCSVAILNTSTSTGQTLGMWEIGALAFTLVILVVNFKLALYQHRWTILEFTFMFLSIILWFITAFILSSAPSVSSNWFDLFPTLLSTVVFHLGLLLVPILALSKDFFAQGYIRNFQPRNEHILQETLKKFSTDPFVQSDLQSFQDLMIPSSVPSLEDYLAFPSFKKEKSPYKRKTSSTFAIGFDPETAHAEAELCLDHHHVNPI